MNAVVIGATGATGKCLVGSLLKAKVNEHKMAAKSLVVQSTGLV